MPLFGLMNEVVFYAFLKVVRSFFIAWSLSVFFYLISAYGFSLLFLSLLSKSININHLVLYSVIFSMVNSLSLNVILSKIGFFSPGEFSFFPLIVSFITIMCTLFWMVMMFILLFHKKKTPIPEE